MAKQLTQEQALIVTGYTGVLAIKDFSLLHEDIEKRLGRPVLTHEIPSLKDEIKQAYKDDFRAICSIDGE